MLKIKKLFTCFVLAVLLISSSVFATDDTVTSISDEEAVTTEESISDEESVTTEETTPTNIANTLYEDIYIYDTDSYTLSDNVYGNIFASTTKFVTNPRNNGAIVSGNLYLISNEVIIGSDVSYSENKDKAG